MEAPITLTAQASSFPKAALEEKLIEEMGRLGGGMLIFHVFRNKNEVHL